MTRCGPRKPAHPSRAAGFSLIELMIVLAIIAVIAAITYPSYERSVLKSHRSDVEAMLTQDAQILQRCYTQYFTYTPSATNNCNPMPLVTTSEHGYYALTKTVFATTYMLTATAIGTQIKDTQCQTFKLSSTGQKTAYSSSDADNSAECWSR